jgi:hypothetical protein
MWRASACMSLATTSENEALTCTARATRGRGMLMAHITVGMHTREARIPDGAVGHGSP